MTRLLARRSGHRHPRSVTWWVELQAIHGSEFHRVSFCVPLALLSRGLDRLSVCLSRTFSFPFLLLAFLAIPRERD